MKPEQNGGDNNNKKESLRKGPWMPEEDEILIQYVRQYGPRDWNSIGARGLLPRTGKSCRLRWVNKLKPDLKSGCKFSPEEEKMVMEMQSKLGNKWAKIASYLPGRTDNDVKNFWSTRQKRMMRALQSPKVHSTITDNVAFTDFSNFQQQMKSSSQTLMMQGNTFETPFCTFAEEAAYLSKDPSMEFRRVRQKTMTFSNEVDNSLMVKLQDLVASDSVLDQQQPGVVYDSSEGSTVSSTLNNDPNNNYRSCRPHAKHSRQGTSMKREMSTSNLEFTQVENQGAIMEDQIQISSTHDNICDFEVDLYIDAKDSNILDFLLQPEEDVTSSTQNSSTISSDDQQQPQNQNHDITDNSMSENQWEKMQLRPGNIQTADPAIKEEVESYTPTSILQTGFPTDVFEALEPLSPTTSIWWDSDWAL
eukprot:PITA_06988